MVPGGEAPGGRWGANRAIREEEAHPLDLLGQAPRPVAQPEGGRARKYCNCLPSRLYSGQMCRLVDP